MGTPPALVRRQGPRGRHRRGRAHGSEQRPRGDDLDGDGRLRRRRDRDLPGAAGVARGAGAHARARPARHGGYGKRNSLGVRRAARQGRHTCVVAGNPRRRPHGLDGRRAIRAIRRIPRRHPGGERKPGTDRRAVEHVDGLRRRRDHEGLPPVAARGQPGHRGAGRAVQARREAHRPVVGLGGGRCRRTAELAGDAAGIPDDRHRRLGARHRQRAGPDGRGRPARRRGRR